MANQTQKYYDLYSARFRANPYPTYADIRAQSPIMALPGQYAKVWLVTGYDEVKLILSDHKRFVKDYRNTLTDAEKAQVQAPPDLYQMLFHSMLSVDKPDHTRLRALVSKAFTQQRVMALEPRIQAIANELIDAFPQDGTLDLIDHYAFPLPIIVICELLGIPAEDRAKFRLWSNAVVDFGTPHGNYAQHMFDFLHYIMNVVAERRAHPQDDLISELTQVEEDGQRLTEQELYSMIVLLIIAGHETTVNLIGNGLLALLQYPDQMALLKADPSLTPNAIEEFLRYDNPVERATERYAAEDVQIDGHLIRRGEIVIVALGAANRDSTLAEEPDILDITRENNKHLGFGYGVHYCLGAPLARLEGRIAVNKLLQRTQNLELAIPPEDLNYRDSAIVRGLSTLPVNWMPS